MRLLVDTHAFLWLLAGDARLRASARRRIEDGRNDKLLSVASIWEMAIKLSLGKLRLDDPLEEVITRGTRDANIALLAITKSHAIRVSSLPWHHRDPFDRLLVAQALEEGLTLLAGDRVFDLYDAPRVW